MRMSLKEDQIARALFTLSLETQEHSCFSFRVIAAEAGIPAKGVRRPVRALARKGLAIYERGLWRWDGGGPAGAGYRLTELGLAEVERLHRKDGAP